MRCFAGPGMCAEAMRAWGIAAERIIEINRGEQRDLAGVPVTAVLAHHVSNAGAQTPDAVGYVFDLGGIASITRRHALSPDLQQVRELRPQVTPDLQQVRELRPHVMLVCINGGYGNMGPEDAARLTAEIEPAVVSRCTGAWWPKTRPTRICSSAPWPPPEARPGPW